MCLIQRSNEVISLHNCIPQMISIVVKEGLIICSFTRLCFKMNVVKFRYRRRVFVGSSALFFLILLVYILIFKSTNSHESNTGQTKICDQTIIQQYFMGNQRYNKLIFI